MWKGCRPQVGWVLPITVYTCVARLDCQYFGSSCLRGWKTAARCTEWPLAFASGIIADFTLTDCNYTRNKGKIVHIIYTDIHIHTDIKKIYICKKYTAACWSLCCKSSVAVHALFFLLAQDRLCSRPIRWSKMLDGWTLAQLCWDRVLILNTAPQIDVAQTSLCWNLTTNMLKWNDIMLFICWALQPVHFTLPRRWQKNVV